MLLAEASTKADCPYPEETDGSEEWTDGWLEAEHYGTDEEVKDNL